MISNDGKLKEKFEKELEGILESHSVKEMKWSETKSDVKVDTIIESLDLFLSYIKNWEKIRVDVLIWDIEDSRHRIQGRDDIKNLQIMYYHLLENVINHRWPKKVMWHIYPDENSAVDWKELKKITSRGCKDSIIKELKEKSSKENVMIQLADIFAGMGAYSWGNIEKYYCWIRDTKKQRLLFDLPECNLSHKDRYRWKIIDHFYSTIRGIELKCKEDIISGDDAISLNRPLGLSTKYPTCPVNFWLYKPQTDKDKAPQKNQIFPRARNDGIKNEWW